MSGSTHLTSAEGRHWGSDMLRRSDLNHLVEHGMRLVARPPADKTRWTRLDGGADCFVERGCQALVMRLKCSTAGNGW